MSPTRGGEALASSSSPSVERWLSAKDAAEIMGVSLKAVYTLCRTEGLRHARLTNNANGVMRFRRSWLDAWLEARAHGGEERS